VRKSCLVAHRTVPNVPTALSIWYVMGLMEGNIRERRNGCGSGTRLAWKESGTMHLYRGRPSRRDLSTPMGHLVSVRSTCHASAPSRYFCCLRRSRPAKISRGSSPPTAVTRRIYVLSFLPSRNPRNAFTDLPVVPRRSYERFYGFAQERQKAPRCLGDDRCTDGCIVKRVN